MERAAAATNLAGEHDDTALLRQAAGGDTRAMRSLYGRHGGRVHALALRLTGRAADAEDVVQHTFLRAWSHGSGFRGDASVGTWLCRVAINACREMFRRKSREVGLGPDERLDAAQAPRDAPLANQLERALSQLSDGYREVIVMHDVLGMDHADIAAALDVEVGTSKSQLHKARARMREILSHGAI